MTLTDGRWLQKLLCTWCLNRVIFALYRDPKLQSLFEKLHDDVLAWRKSGYGGTDCPLIGEILAWQMRPGSAVDDPNPQLKFLRAPQFLALETYWYVRLRLGTPHIMDLYKHYYRDDKEALFDALGVPVSRDALEYAGVDEIIKKVRTNLEFVAEKRIQAVHEAVTLEYPSYIFALAMGAGKTILIGAIVATEFAMSLRHPGGKFMKNALVFAPGTTIIESLRELSGMPYEKILPPDLNRDFLANLKIEFPGRGKEVQAQTSSSYNLIVTNTEKISLRVNRRSNQQLEAFEREEVQANLRLQKIASLPNLGIFSDEAHHTYGNTFDKLKRVRETINYIHRETEIVAVINTTGTPYYKKQSLKEVLVWYGLGEGIKNNILKDLSHEIHLYNMKKQSAEAVFNDIIEEFFKSYGGVTLPNGAKAKIAFYFKSQEHLEESRRFIERAMTNIGEAVSQILVNTQTSDADQIKDFKRLNNPGHQKRVILLISKGVEGWNCPSLFACALIKEQTSNNYVLQAATRCLRQVPGNTYPAKIFLDYDNANILGKQLKDNFRTDLGRLAFAGQNRETVTLRILKPELPKLEITRTVKRAVRAGKPGGNVRLQKPRAQKPPAILRSVLTPDFSGAREILMPTGEMKELPVTRKVTDCHTAAWKIATRYHLPVMQILKTIKGLYPKGEVPDSHLYGLFKQVESQQADYKTVEEKITEAMALIRVKDEDGNDVFEKDADGVYVHRLRLLGRTVRQMKEGGLLTARGEYKDEHDLSFHYTPYNFDSEPERSLFQQVLSVLGTDPDDVEAFLFTGGLTDTGKTDFHFEYLGEDKRYHRYFPDFVLVKKTGEFYIVEVKAESERGDETVERKRKAVERLAELQPDRFKYQVVYTGGQQVSPGETKPVIDWVRS